MREIKITLAICMMAIAIGASGQSREQLGGIYYAYPDGEATNLTLPEAPAGFEPVYISHYGRHGSRWPVNPKAYKIASDFFQEQQIAENLTQEGREVWKMVTLCAGNANGHLGELTTLGERQHHDIALRMMANFPQLFKDGGRVEARSSTQPRCIMSMAAFTDALRTAKPSLDIRRHATPGDMDFIHHQTEEAELMNSDLAPWRWDFDPTRDSLAMVQGVISRLFKNHPDSVAISPEAKIATIPAFTRALYDIAISVQNIPGLEADLYSLFTEEELKNLWLANNYIQYVGNGCSPLTGAIGPACARPLLKEISERAEGMLATGEVPVDLRFGHDTDLLRLVSLMGINSYDVETEDIYKAASEWPNYAIAPMAGNLQLIFYRNDAGEVIFLPLLNENPARIKGAEMIGGGYYPVSLLKELAEEEAK